MKSVNASSLRQSLGRVLRLLEENGEPIVVERSRKPAAVLISLRDYQERFVDHSADEHRREAVGRIRAMRFRLRPGETSLDLLRELRNGSK